MTLPPRGIVSLVNNSFQHFLACFDITPQQCLRCTNCSEIPCLAINQIKALVKNDHGRQILINVQLDVLCPCYPVRGGVSSSRKYESLSITSLMGSLFLSLCLSFHCLRPCTYILPPHPIIHLSPSLNCASVYPHTLSLTRSSNSC